MNSIEFEIRNWTSVSDAQREIQEETLNLMCLEEFTPPPLECRTHHIESLLEVSRFWMRCRWEYPWLPFNKTGLIHRIHSIAFTHTEAKIKLYKTNPFTEYTDTIDVTSTSQENTRRSFYLFDANFLLRSARFHDDQITFSSNPTEFVPAAEEVFPDLENTAWTLLRPDLTWITWITDTE